MHDLPLISTIAAAFTASWVLGLITQRLRLSPIVGYIIAGILIGPHTPGFIGDTTIAPQLAELGVILLMFGVGLHFQLDDLLSVKSVAVPGAIGQSAVSTVLGLAVAFAFGFPLKTGLVLGIAMAVASTVVLIRVLEDNKLLDTTHGHVAVGWLIVEDLLTVVVLVLIPALAGASDASTQPARGSHGAIVSLLIALLKLAVLVVLMLLAGSKVIPWVMVQVARLRSRELFTLTVMVMAIAIAAGSAYAFGASMALGAFLAGMVVGQSPVSQQAAADALPLRDAFAVLFFASVGMLFDPHSVTHEPGIILACLSIVLVFKPLAAMTLIALIGYPARTAIVVALGLAQIGEFSFILSEVARRAGLMTDAAHNVLVVCAIISITVNPLLFRLLSPIEGIMQRRWPMLWRFMNRKAIARETKMNAAAVDKIERTTMPLAVILGYGPVGRAVDSILLDQLQTVIVDLNMDTVRALTKKGRAAIYGDAFNIEVMHQALPNAKYLIITLPHSTNRGPLIAAAKLINPEIRIFVRARYVSEREGLVQTGADAACFEEAEVAVALARLVLQDRGAQSEDVQLQTQAIRRQLKAESPRLHES